MGMRITARQSQAYMIEQWPLYKHAYLPPAEENIVAPPASRRMGMPVKPPEQSHRQSHGLRAGLMLGTHSQGVPIATHRPAITDLGAGSPLPPSHSHALNTTVLASLD